MSTTKKKVKNRRIVVVLVSLLILIILLISLKMCNSHSVTAPEIIAGEFLPDMKDATKSKAQAQAAVDKSKFTLTVYPEAKLTTKDNQTAGYLFIRNDASNAYPINVKVTLDETKELLYESGGIEPGYEISSVTLAKTLKAGTYKATATVDVFDAKTKKKRGVTQAEIKLHVE